MHLTLTNTPLLFFGGVAITMSLAAWFGVSFLKQRWPLEERSHDDFRLLLTATVTLLGLVIGFTLSMAMSRYNQRKDYEEAEANAIGTEFLRADLLPAADAAQIRTLLLSYLRERVSFYGADNENALRSIVAATGKTESALWTTVMRAANERRDAVSGLAVAGMNDVLNSRGFTIAAWSNRIPRETWVLLFLIALGSNLMFAYNATKLSAILVILPVLVATAFLLIADIDSPWSGIVRIAPQNLTSLLATLTPH